MDRWLPAAFLAALLGLLPMPAAQQAAPLRLAIAGLVHGHVSGFLRAAQARTGRADRRRLRPRRGAAAKYAERYKLADAALFTDLAAMLDRAKPEAVASFTNTHDHPADRRGRRGARAST